MSRPAAVRVGSGSKRPGSPARRRAIEPRAGSAPERGRGPGLRSAPVRLDPGRLAKATRGGSSSIEIAVRRPARPSRRDVAGGVAGVEGDAWMPLPGQVGSRHRRARVRGAAIDGDRRKRAPATARRHARERVGRSSRSAAPGRSPAARQPRQGSRGRVASTRMTALCERGGNPGAGDRDDADEVGPLRQGPERDRVVRRRHRQVGLRDRAAPQRFAGGAAGRSRGRWHSRGCRRAAAALGATRSQRAPLLASIQRPGPPAVGGAGATSSKRSAALTRELRAPIACPRATTSAV